MTDENSATLTGLQELDKEIATAEGKLVKYEPLLEELDGPVVQLESELTTLESRITEMQAEERRLERSLEERRERNKGLQEKLQAVRNIREEAAVRAEQDMLSHALETDESEALTVLDQLRKSDDRLAEVTGALDELRIEIEPRRNEILKEQSESSGLIADLKARRSEYAGRVDEEQRGVYETIRANGRVIAVSPMTGDGACGHCFSMVPLQLQNEIRHGAQMIRCEACGVIVVEPDPEQEATPEEAVAEVVASDEAASDEDTAEDTTSESDVEEALSAEAGDDEAPSEENADGEAPSEEVSD